MDREKIYSIMAHTFYNSARAEARYAIKKLNETETERTESKKNENERLILREGGER